MQASLQAKYDHLCNLITEAGSAIIAFSGGVDSTFLLQVCVDKVGEKALAITARSETFPERELKEAKNLADLKYNGEPKYGLQKFVSMSNSAGVSRATCSYLPRG